MTEKGTYSDPRCYACRPLAPASNEIEDKRINAFLASHGFDLLTATVTQRVEASYNRFADRIAAALNKRIPGPDISSDVLRKARSE